MEPFSIACTTCQARLRVRDESVIGQILTCPKCGSMVLVEPVAAVADSVRGAESSVSEGSAPAQEMAPSREILAPPDDFEGAASLLDEPSEPAVPNSPDLTETVEDIAVQAESGLRTEDNIDPGDAKSWKNESDKADEPDDAAASELSPPPLPAHGEALLPNADWTSASTAKWRNRMLTGIAAVVGVVLAVVLLIAFSGIDQSATNASSPTTPSIIEIVPERPEPDALDEPPEEPGTAPDPVSPPAQVARDDERPDVLPPEAAVDVSLEPPIELPQETPAPSDVGPATSDPPPDEPPGLTPKAATTDTAETGRDASPLAETLREFGALLERTEESMSPLPAAPAELPREAESDDSEADPVARRTGPRLVEVADRLKDPVLGFDFEGKPLVNFLRLVSDCSTIPITLDADILRWARVSPLTAVNVKASDTAVGEILKQGLAPLGLEYRIESDQLFVTRRTKDETGMRTVTFNVKDLVGDDAAQLQQLGTHIMDFASPESWSGRGGSGTMTFRESELIIEQHETVHFEILEFCEKLRVARGLDKRSPYDAAMFRLQTRSERAHENLAKPIRLTYIQPAPLQRIIDRIAEDSQLHILIDWRALAEADWGPDAEVRFSVTDQPVAQALTTLLAPLDLAYRVIDESTLQVTTPAVVDSRLEIEFYSVSKPADDGTKLVQAARDALGSINFRDFGGSSQLAYDEPSNCLMAYLSQTQQLELQAWLKKL